MITWVNSILINPFFVRKGMWYSRKRVSEPPFLPTNELRYVWIPHTHAHSRRLEHLARVSCGTVGLHPHCVWLVPQRLCTAYPSCITIITLPCQREAWRPDASCSKMQNHCRRCHDRSALCTLRCMWEREAQRKRDTHPDCLHHTVTPKC